MRFVRRIYMPGAYYFFTVVCYQRANILVSQVAVDRLKSAIKIVKTKYPFKLNAYVVLPNHMHCIWRLPEGDFNFSMRWRLIKYYFSRSLGERHQKNIWQPRFWDHVIRDQDDWVRHLDYIHYNPVKHGLVNKPTDWLHSSFHDYVTRGFYDVDWGVNEPENIADMIFE